MVFVVAVVKRRGGGGVLCCVLMTSGDELCLLKCSDSRHRVRKATPSQCALSHRGCVWSTLPTIVGLTSEVVVGVHVVDFL